MSIVRKVEMGLALMLLVLVAALAGATGYYRWQAGRTQQNYEVAAGDARAASVYIAAHKGIERERGAKNAKVEAVLEENRDWRDEPVPDDVADLLRHPTGTSRAVP